MHDVFRFMRIFGAIWVTIALIYNFVRYFTQICIIGLCVYLIYIGWFFPILGVIVAIVCGILYYEKLEKEKLQNI